MLRRLIRRITVAPDLMTQRRIVRRAIVVFRDKNPDRWPTIREICQQAQLGHSQVFVALEKLSEQGVVEDRLVGVADERRAEWVLVDAEA